MNKRTWTDEQLIQSVAQSFSVAEVIKNLGLSSSGHAQKRINQWIKELQISIDHFTKPSKFPIALPLEQILIENSTYTGNGQDLKKKLFKHGLLKTDQCSECGQLPLWNKKELVLQLDHINGVHNDNRLENLRILCPNCHTQSSTFGTRKLKRVKPVKQKRVQPTEAELQRSINQRKIKNRPCEQDLIDLLLTKSYCEVGRIYDVSDNTIRKWLKYYAHLEGGSGGLKR